MLVGSGKCELVFPEDFFPTEGFTVQAHPLYVRALVIGATRPFVLISIEMTSLPDGEAERLCQLAAASAGTKPEQVWITVTHTFSAPHIMPDELLKNEADRERKAVLQSLLQDAVHTAALHARNSARDVDITLREGVSDIPTSRDIELAKGWWIGCDGEGPANRKLTLLQFGAEPPVALLIHMNVQPSVLDGTGAADGKCVSGDIVGILCAYFERRFPGAVCLFMIGAAGDQAPIQRAKGLARNADNCWEDIDLGAAGIPLAERLGVQLIEEVRALMMRGPGEAITGEVSLSHGSVTVPAKKMNRNLRELRPTRSCEWEPNGDVQQPFSVLRLGNLAITGVKPELTYETDAAIKAASPFPHTLTATLVNGSAKYMAAQSAYDRCMYEAINSPFMPGAAEVLAEAVIAELKGASL